MKSFNKLAAVFCLFAGLIFGSCDDNLSKVGTTIQPPEDLITVYTDTFRMEAYTVKLDSVFAKTSSCMLGEMFDPLYGNIKADILCQFYCEEGFKFAKTPYNGKVDSIELVIEFPLNNGSLVVYGDTMTPMQATVYAVNKPLTRNFYTNDNPENYCDMKNPLGSTSYTTYDVSISDSIRSITAADDPNFYVPNICVKLPTELGQSFYNELVNNPSTFESQNAFNEFFPGVYITNTFGSGCVIKNTSSDIFLRIYYDYELEASDGSDSIARAVQWFTISKEVIQINRFKNSNIDKLLEQNPTHTYIKSPAGVCTKLVLPTTEISKKLDVSDRFINDFNLDLKYLPEDEWDFAYYPPSCLLLIPEDSVKSFFENGNVEDGTTSFISYYYGEYGNSTLTSSSESSLGYNYNTRTYSFGNISALLETHIKNSPDKDLSMLVLPVNRSVITSNSSYYTSAIFNSFDLAGVKIRTEDEYMKVVVLSSKFENK